MWSQRRFSCSTFTSQHELQNPICQESVLYSLRFLNSLWRLTIYTLHSAVLFIFLKDVSTLNVLLSNAAVVKKKKKSRESICGAVIYAFLDIQRLIAGVERLNKDEDVNNSLDCSSDTEYLISATECIILCWGKCSINWSENAFELNWFWIHSLGSPAVREESSFVQYRGWPTLLSSLFPKDQWTE